MQHEIVNKIFSDMHELLDTYESIGVVVSGRWTVTKETVKFVYQPYVDGDVYASLGPYFYADLVAPDLPSPEEMVAELRRQAKAKNPIAMGYATGHTGAIGKEAADKMNSAKTDDVKFYVCEVLGDEEENGWSVGEACVFKTDDAWSAAEEYAHFDDANEGGYKLASSSKEMTVLVSEYPDGRDAIRISISGDFEPTYHAISD